MEIKKTTIWRIKGATYMLSSLNIEGQYWLGAFSGRRSPSLQGSSAEIRAWTLKTFEKMEEYAEFMEKLNEAFEQLH
jgi:hypothetical protein